MTDIFTEKLAGYLLMKLMDKENERRLKNFANACNLNCDII